MGDKEFDSSPEIQKAFTNTNYNFRNMNDDDIINFANILGSVDYNTRLDSNSTRSKCIKTNLQNRNDKILNPLSSLPASEIEESSDELDGSVIAKIIIPSNIFDIWSRLEVLLEFTIIWSYRYLIRSKQFNR